MIDRLINAAIGCIGYVATLVAIAYLLLRDNVNYDWLQQ